MTDIGIKADKKTAIGVIQMFIGVFLFLVFFTIALFNRIWTSISGDTISTSAVFTLLIIFLAGFLIFKGYKNYKLASRYRRINRIVGDDTSIKLSQLEDKLDWSKEKVIKALTLQISKGFWKESYLDIDSGLFLIGYNPIHLKTSSENQALHELLNKANGYIHEMTTINRSIDDINMKNHVDTLINIAKQIYTYIEEHQEKANLVRQLTNYFLPTTVELLASYLELQNQNVKSDGMIVSMSKIADMMESLDSAYKNQLDMIYSEKSLDVSVEIDVMKKIIDI